MEAGQQILRHKAQPPIYEALSAERKEIASSALEEGRGGEVSVREACTRTGGKTAPV